MYTIWAGAFSSDIARAMASSEVAPGAMQMIFAFGVSLFVEYYSVDVLTKYQW